MCLGYQLLLLLRQLPVVFASTSSWLLLLIVSMHRLPLSWCPTLCCSRLSFCAGL
jgi:hypothetical protein